VSYRPRQIPVSSRAEAIIKGTRFWGVGFEPDTVVAPADRSDGELMVRQRTPPQRSLRAAAKQMLAAPSAMALWQASRAEPQLSADAAITERKERFLALLEGVRRDYF
jgi:succinoglycan biosynthesis protein ExoV